MANNTDNAGKQEELKEEAKSLYLANYKDYALVNADESFRDGIEVGVWGMKEKFKEYEQTDFIKLPF